MKKFDQINVIPFIDIMLVLLAIVLVTATFISQGKIEVTIPKSSSNMQLKQQDLVKLLAITKAGEYYQNDKLVTLEQLDNDLSTWDKNNKITLKVDAATPFQKFVEVTDLFSRYGLKKVAIMTLKEKK